MDRPPPAAIGVVFVLGVRAAKVTDKEWRDYDRKLVASSEDDRLDRADAYARPRPPSPPAAPTPRSFAKPRGAGAAVRGRGRASAPVLRVASIYDITDDPGGIRRGLGCRTQDASGVLPRLRPCHAELQGRLPLIA